MTLGEASQEKRRAIATLIVLSVFWALGGLAPDLFPALRHSAIPALERQAIIYALFAMAASFYAVARRKKRPSFMLVITSICTGTLMFAVPVLLSFFALAWVSQLERVAIFSLTPVFAVVLEPYVGNSSHRSSGAMLAGLVAVAGALTIFPLSVPGTPTATLAAFAVVVAAACAAIGNCIVVRVTTSQKEFSTAAACGAWMCGAAALTFLLASACVEHASWRLPPNFMQVIWLVAIDLPPLLLLFWLFSRMSATRMTARFLLAPLFTVLAGIALEQPQITVRMVIGTTLLAAGATWLLLADESDESVESIGLL